MQGLLKLSRAIDYVNDRFGEVANWLVLFACLISAGNAASRYLFSASSEKRAEVLIAIVGVGPTYDAVNRRVSTHVPVQALWTTG